MNIDGYCQRINYSGPLEPNPAVLKALHRAHLLTVPFENLDIHLGREIVLDEARLFDKIVTRRRGGFCYELNGLFAWLLETIGFEVQRLSARVYGHEGFGPDFDHLLLRIEAGGRSWLGDVGFGDNFLEPLPLFEEEEQIQENGVYRLVRSGRVIVLERWEGADDAPWAAQYIFALNPHRLADFADMCRYHQTSPNSSFPRRRLCSLATPAGRITLKGMTLIETAHGRRTETAVPDMGQYLHLLRERFKIELSDPSWVNPLNG